MINNLLIESDKILQKPSEPGVYLLIKTKNSLAVDLQLKILILINENLFVKDYISINGSICFALPPEPISKFLTPNFKWYFIQQDISKNLL
jgi:hypothetical protein